MKLIAIVGPTASGKSELAVFLAKQTQKHRWGGYTGAEIVSADSRQVYKYLDVGTNKVPGAWQQSSTVTILQNNRVNKGITNNKNRAYSYAIAGKYALFLYKTIPHHCIDFVHPRKTFTVAQYKQCAEQAMQEIQERGNIPILAGGTGFYMDAILYGTAIPEVPPNNKLRKILEKKSVEELFIMLKKLDPGRASSIDAKNPRRLIRAIEIITATGKPIPPLGSSQKQGPGNTILMIGIRHDPNQQKKRVEKMVRHMIHNGLLAETRMLKDKLHLSKKRIRELGFEYRCVLNYLEARLPSELGRPVSKLHRLGLIQELAKENGRYAKRQMTWFRRNKHIHWIRAKKDALELTRAFVG